MVRLATLLVMFVWSIQTLSIATARAGMILDEISDSLYTNYGSRFASVGKIGTASGTLIAPNWVVTAGHVAIGNFTIGGNTYAAAEMIKHPQFLANGSNVGYGYDIAVMRLSTPVVGIAPSPFYIGNGELGAMLSITGYGETGVGSTGQSSNPGTLRGGTNIADELMSFSNGPGGQVGAQNAVLLSDFDALASRDPSGSFNTLGTRTATDLEYHLAIGDSGGGVFIQENGTWYLAGVNSFVASQRDWTGSGNTLPFGYGAVSGFTRVSSFKDFIQSATGVPEPSSLGLIISLSIGYPAWWLRHTKRRRSIPQQQNSV